MPSLPRSPSRQRAALLLLALVAAGTLGLLLVGRLKTKPRGAGGPSAPAPPVSTPPAAPSLPALPAGTLRIGLDSLGDVSEVRVKLVSGGLVLDGQTGKKLAHVPANRPLEAAVDGSSVRLQGAGLSLERTQLVLSGGLIRVGGRVYPGRIRLRTTSANTSALQVFNELGIEQYLEGVLPGEIPPGFDVEAQKALAVAARTYALVQHGKHGEYDLCDGTHCQMYLGYRRTSKRGLAAVRATRHLCLWYGPDLAYPFYEADCGGISTSVDEVPLKDKPSGPLPYLRIVRDAPAHGPDYCAKSPFHHWVRRLTRQELEERLNGRPETAVGTLRDVVFSRYDRSGRVTEVQLAGEQAAAPAETQLGAAGPSPGSETQAAVPVRRTVSGWEFRRSVGARVLKSTRVRLDRPEPDLFRFTGAGNGHGLGLCQIGANGMAAHGFGFRAILAHYYPGTRLSSLPGPRSAAARQEPGGDHNTDIEANRAGDRR